MEHSIEFRDNQELQAADFNNMQDWAQQGLDHVVLDTINAGKAYSGFTISKTGQTQIATTPGRLYSSGLVYARDEVVTLDLFNQLPVSTQKQFAVVAWGQTVDEDIQPRNFLIDADTGQAEPQSVAMESTRFCNLNIVAGVESADPQLPTIDSSVTLIGYVRCDPTGILSFQQSTDTQVDNLALLAVRIETLEAWRAIVSGAIDTLRTDLANLAKQFALYTPLTDFQALVTLVNWIYNQVQKLTTAYTWLGTDYFADTSQSNIGANVDGLYNAAVIDGLRFPGTVTAALTTLQLLNSAEPLVRTDAGWTIPKPSGSRIRYDCSFTESIYDWVDDRILQYTFWNYTCRHLSPSRKRHRCGPQYIPTVDAVVFKQQAQLDAISVNLQFTTESWTQVRQDLTNQQSVWNPDYPRYSQDRLVSFWRDYVDVPYWSKVFSNFSHSGQTMVQTFFNAQDGWLSGITLFTTKQAFYQPFNLFVHECDDQGKPDISRIVRRLVLSGTDVQGCYGTPIWGGDIFGIDIEPNSGDIFRWRTRCKAPVYIYPVRINFPPVFLRAGQRFALHINSTQDHSWSCTTRGEAYSVHQGHFWYSNGTDLVCWQTSPKSMRFFAHFAVWGQWGGQSSPGGQLRYEIQLQPLQLAGGVAGVDVLAETIEPKATNISYEVQLGGVWVPFNSGSNAPAFPGNPALVPFRVVYTGTTDLMPGISFTNNQVTVHGPRATTFHHISNSITCSSTSTGMKIVTRLKGFDAAHHTFSISIHYGATNNTSPTIADKTLDDGTLERTATFAAAAQTSFFVKLDGTTDGTSLFVVKQRAAFSS